MLTRTKDSDIMIISKPNYDNTHLFKWLLEDRKRAEAHEYTKKKPKRTKITTPTAKKRS